MLICVISYKLFHSCNERTLWVNKFKEIALKNQWIIRTFDELFKDENKAISIHVREYFLIFIILFDQDLNNWIDCERKAVSTK